MLEAIEESRITTTMLVPSMIYALLDHPKLRPDRSLEPADDLLRSVADVSDALAGGDPQAGPDLLPVLRPDGMPPGGLRPPEGGP